MPGFDSPRRCLIVPLLGRLRRSTSGTARSMSGLRVVVTGATGNVGTCVITALSAEEGVESVLGLSRRPTDWTVPKTRFAVSDVRRDNLESHFEGADVVIHLAWLFQPARRPEITWENNVSGSLRVFRAVAQTGVPALIHASSVGAYSPGRNQPAVSEDWPTHGWPGASYPREKAYLERCLDIFEDRHRTRVVRMRPAFIFQKSSATAQRRLFAGPFLPGSLVSSFWIPVLPQLPALSVQVGSFIRCSRRLRSSDFGRAARRIQPGSGSARRYEHPRRFVRRTLDRHSGARNPGGPLGGMACTRCPIYSGPLRHRDADSDDGLLARTYRAGVATHSKSQRRSAGIFRGA